MGWISQVFSLILISLFLLSSPSTSQPTTTTTNDTQALTLFRLQTDTHGNLLTNWTSGPSGNACSAFWLGAKCTNGRVTSLSLPSLDLRGPIDSLARLDQLRFLDLHSNRFNSTILPIITNCSDLKLLFLSGNDFSGKIPTLIGSLKRLLRFDLSDNNLRGPIPEEISKLTRLINLRLQNNVLSGKIPNLSLSVLRELNLSNNELFGEIPEDLHRKFGDRSFVGNAGVCGSGGSGSLVPVCSFTKSPPSAAAAAASAQDVVPSNPSSILVHSTSGDESKNGSGSRKGLSILKSQMIFYNAAISVILTKRCQ